MCMCHMHLLYILHVFPVSPYVFNEKESTVDEFVSNPAFLPAADLVEENVLSSATDQPRTYVINFKS